jgi:acyl-CoA synthetase (AMP-forming)/AMP-acid ligase II
MATATHGSAIVFPTEAFNALATLEAVREYKCTALYGVPTMFVAELELLANGVVPYEGFQHLRTGIAAGSSIPAELMRKLHKVLNLTELTICYGMTETSPVSAMTTTDDPIEKRIDTVGRLLPHVRAKVVHPADWSQTLKVGQRGELAVSGYLLMKGYWGDTTRTQQVMQPDKDGVMWMHTGDEASMDEDTSKSLEGSRTSSSKAERTFIRWRLRIVFSLIQLSAKSASSGYRMRDTEKLSLLLSSNMLENMEM